LNYEEPLIQHKSPDAILGVHVSPPGSAEALVREVEKYAAVC